MSRTEHSNTRVVRWLLVALLAACGCSSSSGPKLAPVSGVVRYKGQPIKDIAVVFHAPEGLLASGITDAEGKFQLSTISPGDGAPVGEQQVTFVYKDPTENVDPPPSPIPLRYRTAETSRTTVTVERKSNEFTFDLTEN
jgi:hypothetical protein